MAELGFLTNEQESALSKIIDDAIVLKNPFLELVDGYLAKIVLTVVDDKLLEKIALKVVVDIKAQISALVDAAMAEDVALSEELAANLINNLVNIPGLEEETEGLIFKGAVQLLVGALLSWIQNIKGEPVVLKLA